MKIISTSQRLDSPSITGDAAVNGTLTVASNEQYTSRIVRNMIISTAEPTADDGQDGDIWVVYEEA